MANHERWTEHIRSLPPLSVRSSGWMVQAGSPSETTNSYKNTSLCNNLIEEDYSGGLEMPTSQ